MVKKLVKKKGVGRNGNMIPPVKGEIRNPNGRPKGSRNRSTIVREMLEALHASGRPNVDAMTAAIVNKALNGDVMAWDKLMDSGYGKITDKTDIAGSLEIIIRDMNHVKNK